MKKRILITLVLAIFIVIGICEISDAFSHEFPQVSAENAAVIHMDSGELLYGKNENKRAYPASITKILTALVVIECAEGRKAMGESAGLDQVIRVSPGAVGAEGSSIYLQPEEKISVRDLLYGLMLRSGNDAATALAEEFGGMRAFVAAMNERSLKIGAVSSHFMNPSGLHDENHYTTAEDMALIAREAMKNEEFRKIVGAKSWESERDGSSFKLFLSKNKVIHEYKGGTGIKIGFTKAAGRTLVASSSRGDMELISVVLSAPNWFQDAYSLMDSAYAIYEEHRISKGEKPINTVKVTGSLTDRVKVGLKKEASCAVKKDEKSNISLVYRIPKEVRAPVSRWREAGTLDVYRNKKFLYSTPLYFLEDAERLGERK